MAETSPERIAYEANGITLVADLWRGEDDHVPVVLAHGGGQTRNSWGRTAQRLAAGGRTVLNYDSRGHGESAWDPGGDYALDAFAGDLLALIGQLPRRPILVGASLGGIAALLVAGEHPDVAAAIVLVDVVVDVEPAGVRRIRDFMRAHADEGFASLEEVAAEIASYTPERKRPANIDGIRKNVRLHDDGRWYWHWDPAFIGEEDETRSVERAARLREVASHVHIPTLIVRGGRSDVVSQAGLDRMLALIPGAESVDVAAAGHMVAGDDNDVFATALTAFISRVEAG